MLDLPIAAFDIETVPDPDMGRRLFGFEGSDAEVVRAMVAKRLEETEGRTEYPEPPLHRIVTIAVAWLDPVKRLFKLDALGGDPWDEASHLEGFFRILGRAKRPPRLVTWNGGGFDLPVIRYRATYLGIPAPELYRTDGEWKWNNYQNRFHSMHVDLMEVFDGYGASRPVGLGLVSQVLGLPGKTVLEGPVYEHILAGDHELVREYCKMDVLLTLLVFLRWLRHSRGVAEEEMGELLGVVAAGLEGEDEAMWGEVRRGLGPEGA